MEKNSIWKCSGQGPFYCVTSRKMSYEYILVFMQQKNMQMVWDEMYNKIQHKDASYFLLTET